ncbi:shikimate dehydrogenase [Fusibacter paucivorans]|uniref:Shikimate dehydrogenase n=1 Tax=Fusibacter paucivorans TaxID=76009 RepID=A0ABS5PUS1_9FIRM|nr:shikimate dehydrogenase [Fusibacter paucivorans]MBS7528141.1 shikimate dehydrogenase [Fusibacter paucivorans]
MKKFGLLGQKLSYSFSPVIHGVIFEYLKLDATYSLIEREPELLDQKAFHDIMAVYDGINVTIPYKSHIMPFLDEIDPAAARIGAVNTVVKRDGRLIGYNTDYFGALASLKALPYSEATGAILLGTGGSSKAVMQCLKALEIEPIYQVSRTPETNIVGENIRQLDYEMLATMDISGCLLVNCTPVGMETYEYASPVPKAVVGRQSSVFDLIYVPAVTTLLAYANEENVPHQNGLDMLMIQAVEAEKLWLSMPDLQQDQMLSHLKDSISI